MFSDLTWKKKILLQEIIRWGGGGGGGAAGAPLTPFLYRPEKYDSYK